MTQADYKILDMYSDILKSPRVRGDKDEENRWEIFCYPLHFNISDWRLPLLTTKKMQWKSLAVELLWFLRGETNVEFLHRHGVRIWDTWANEDGDIGPVYGKLWRDIPADPLASRSDAGGTIDQLANVVASLRYRPQARSHVMVAWRPDWLPLGSIKPCHVYFQFYRYGDELELMLTQRSCDAFLGVPFNIAQFSLLAHIVAHMLGIRAVRFHWIGGDVHIYENHFEQVREQLRREPELNDWRPVPPKVFIRREPQDDPGDYDFNDFELVGYEHMGALPASISPQGKPKQGITTSKGGE